MASAHEPVESAQEGLNNAVDVLVERYGLEGAENRLAAGLSEVRKRKHERAKGPDFE